ncbi:Hypothetical_protein [Hexamita inflata]|uniref:Hypothetical_protein n=1 Tax=Hexamita inflata TaxID=28002 RepID=A0AA86Q2M1_9EUKA|nr:Hypothetical protein HINF_LOCUS38689 [Hexamita inflata]
MQAVTEVTLPNGQTGLFFPLSKTQQDELHQRTNQIQIYYPQPIYQPQPQPIYQPIYQPQSFQTIAQNNQNALPFQTVQNPQVQIIQMPFMQPIYQPQPIQMVQQFKTVQNTHDQVLVMPTMPF